VAASISGIDAKRFPFMVNVSFRKSQKSQGAKSAEYGGCGHTVIFLFYKNYWMRREAWHGALSWSNTKPFAHFCGLFQRTSFRKRSSTPL
jgi:hypothetical protein